MLAYFVEVAKGAGYILFGIMVIAAICFVVVNLLGLINR